MNWLHNTSTFFTIKTRHLKIQRNEIIKAKKKVEIAQYVLEIFYPQNT